MCSREGAGGGYLRHIPQNGRRGEDISPKTMKQSGNSLAKSQESGAPSHLGEVKVSKFRVSHLEVSLGSRRL